MRKILTVTFGILTAIGGFIDIGDLVTDALIGARFGLGLVWVTILAVIGIMTYAEMSARVATATHLPAFDLVRSRVGARLGLAATTGSFFATFLALIAELAGVALAFELLTSVSYLLFIPAVAALMFVLVWRIPFEIMERIYGVLGLALLAFVVAVWHLGPDWGDLARQVTHPPLPSGEGLPTYFFYAIVMLGAQMTPYEVIFFSSEAVEKKWTTADLSTARLNVFIGFPLGGLLAIAIQAVAAIVYFPLGIEVDHLSQTVMPVGLALGRVGLAVVILGVVAATFGATLETVMSSGYALGQYWGWTWGKTVERDEAARFNTLLLCLLVTAAAIGLTTINPITITIYAVFFGAVVLPFTYIPILIAANDRALMGEHVNGRLANGLGSVFLFVTLLASMAALPLLLATKAGL